MCSSTQQRTRGPLMICMGTSVCRSTPCGVATSCQLNSRSCFCSPLRRDRRGTPTTGVGPFGSTHWPNHHFAMVTGSPHKAVPLPPPRGGTRGPPPPPPFFFFFPPPHNQPHTPHK